MIPLLWPLRCLNAAFSYMWLCSAHSLFKSLALCVRPQLVLVRDFVCFGCCPFLVLLTFALVWHRYVLYAFCFWLLFLLVCLGALLCALFCCGPFLSMVSFWCGLALGRYAGLCDFGRGSFLLLAVPFDVTFLRSSALPRIRPVCFCFVF